MSRESPGSNHDDGNPKGSTGVRHTGGEGTVTTREVECRAETFQSRVLQVPLDVVDERMVDGRTPVLRTH